MAKTIRGLFVCLLLLLPLLRAGVEVSDLHPKPSAIAEAQEMLSMPSQPFGKAWEETKLGSSVGFVLRKFTKSERSTYPAPLLQKRIGTALHHLCKLRAEVIPSLPHTAIAFPFREFT